MTSKEFRIWLEGFLTSIDLKEIEIRYSPTYNSLTMLKTISYKLKEVNDIDERLSNTLLTERLIPTPPPPNPFEIKCESKKD